MKTYEATFMLSPLLEEARIYDILQELTSFVQEQGGILGEQHLRGKRPLPAPIKKHKEGYMATLSFTLASEHVGSFKTQCTQQQDILRLLLMQHIKRVKKAPIFNTIRKPSTLEPAPENPQTPDIIETTASTEKKVDLQDIDEKLDEIFKEKE